MTRAIVASLRPTVSQHRAVTRIAVTALTFALVLGISAQEATQAGPETQPQVPDSLLPRNVGVGIDTDATITIGFDAPMDPASVAAALQLLPTHTVALTWNDERTELTVDADRLWRTDERYLVVVGEQARRADGEPIGSTRRFAFTTRTAPRVTDFQLRLAGPLLTAAELEAAAQSDPRIELEGEDVAAPPALPPSSTADGVSAETAISISFSDRMDRLSVAERFAITPAVAGDLSWSEGTLIFTPTERMTAGGRYTISVVGARDLDGNVLGGKANFSFIVRAGAQLTQATPAADAADVEPSTIELWFSQPMNEAATEAALTVTDTTSGSSVAGTIAWNAHGTQLTFTPDAALAAGHRFEVVLGDGALDADGNVVTRSLVFTTKAPPPPPPPPPPPARIQAPTTRVAPAVPAPAPSADLAQYALNQVNAARAAYGRAPLVLDASISAVASAHAWDQANNGYFSHTSLDGRTREDRLRAGGVSFGWSGENQCYYTGISQRATLDWCHAAFMAEPWPGHWNHIANILDTRFTRMGVGIAQVGGRVVITWNFTD